MATEYTIPRKNPQQEVTSFESLRHEGIRLAQQFSGHIWTDYNTHDPGVTILEQFCYALTELIYLADSRIEDYLADAQGTIDTVKQALNLPEQIFSCRPTTTSDLVSALLDALPEVEDIRIRTTHSEVSNHAEPNITPNDKFPGLYHLLIHAQDPSSQDPTLQESTSPESISQAPHWKDRLIDQVRCEYGKQRNLCEDLGEVRLAEDIVLELQADIAISSIRNIPSLLATIYYRCAEQISGTIPVQSYEEEKQQGHRLEEIFRGPYTRNGIFLTEAQNPLGPDISVSTLYSMVQQLPDIQNIISLSIVHSDGTPFEMNRSSELPQCFRLNIPQQPEAMRVRLFRKDRRHPITPEELQGFLSRYAQYQFKAHSERHTEQDLETLYQIPSGNSEGLDHYYSVQHQFPMVYGIGAIGLPDSASLERQAQASQLKAYLMIFEQFLANYQTNLSSVHQVFSLENQDRRSYFFQVLNNTTLPEAELFYQEDPTTSLAATLQKQDHYFERKSRVLDYLLGLYGEQFAQNSLRQFYYYDLPEAIEQRVVANKLRYLKAIVEVGKDRAAGFDYHQTLWPQRLTGFALKLALRLGMTLLKSRPLSQPLLDQPFDLISDALFWEMHAPLLWRNLEGVDTLEHETIQSHETIPLLNASERHEFRNTPVEIEGLFALEDHFVPSLFFTKGINIKRYRLIRLTDHPGYHLIFRAEHQQEWWYLGSFSHADRAIVTANWLRRYWLYLNRVSEGFHIVEHILLRPLGTPSAENSSTQIPSAENPAAQTPAADTPSTQTSTAEISATKVSSNFPEVSPDFYPFRLSLILPNWTARCQDSQFQAFAEQTIHDFTPAHLFPEVHWLDLDAMSEFETLYQTWATAYQRVHQNVPSNTEQEVSSQATPDRTAECNQAAAQLTQFLIQQKQKSTEGSHV